MSLKDDLKRLFFGAKSVAKSTAQKAADAAKEAGGELMDRGAEIADRIKDSASNIIEDIKENTEDARAKAKETLGTVSEKVMDGAKAAMVQGKELSHQAMDWIKNEDEREPAKQVAPPPADPVDNLQLVDEPTEKQPIDFEAGIDTPAEPSALGQGTNQVLDSAAKVGNQALDAAAKAGNQAMETAAKMGEKVMDVSEKVGEKVLEMGSSIMDKAKELGGGIMGKANELVERAQAETAADSLLTEQEKAEQLYRESKERADNALQSTKEGLLDKQDDFFAKAERYAQGDYHNTGLDLNSPKKPATKGFTDADGDGNDLIDDAEIVED